MIARGYDPDFAARCFKQIEGFGSYGFPESHAASFARLVYISSWLKCHHPAAFAAGLLNSQPMGFYAPAEIVRDAREHGVAARGIDVNLSDWDNTLERSLAQDERSTPPGPFGPPSPRGEGWRRLCRSGSVSWKKNIPPRRGGWTAARSSGWGDRCRQGGRA